MAKKQILSIDVETYWDKDHTLSKMTAIEYVMSPKTEIISCAFKPYRQPAVVEFGETHIGQYLAKVDWANTLVIGHNMSEFDALILAYRFGVRPWMWGCTLAMARPLHAKGPGGSLKALAEHYGLRAKGSLEATNTKGKYLRDFTVDELNAMRIYNRRDAELVEELWDLLVPHTPKRELRLIDVTTRMLVQPQFLLDEPLLKTALKDEQARKTTMLAELDEILNSAENRVIRRLEGLPDTEIVQDIEKTLASAAKFGTLLETLGVEVPTKVSPTTGKTIPALAKTDEAFMDLLEHPDERVALAANARLGVRSTILESRIERFLANQVRGWMPVALRYYGADTTGRWSGTMSMNQQNLPRVGKKPKPSDVLRRSLKAPEGYAVVVRDLSGIELRVNHFLWKVPSTMALYQADRKADLYRASGAVAYGCTPAEVTDDQRQLEKIKNLGLGFGAGPGAFQRVARTMGKLQLSDAEAKFAVDTWRTQYPEIVKGWRRCHDALPYIQAGDPFEIDPWGMCTVEKDAIRTPCGMIRYPHLRQNGDGEWVYGSETRPIRIYAGKCTENAVQHLARGVLVDAALRFADSSLGKQYPLAHTVHDELVYVVRLQDAQDVLDYLGELMMTPPSWWPQLITYSEGGIGPTYGDAK